MVKTYCISVFGAHTMDRRLAKLRDVEEFLERRKPQEELSGAE